MTEKLQTQEKTLAQKLKEEDLTLEEKLKLIDEATRNARAKSTGKTRLVDYNAVPVDPDSLNLCWGCQ